jgi:hypothetical protein
MLLHCGKEDGGCWLRAATLDSVTELNELGLALLAEQSAVRCAGAGALLQPLGELWRALDAAARRRAAACPYLLLDAGFGDPARWRTAPAAAQVGDAATELYARYFSVPAAAEVARLMFFYAWHLSRSQPAAARLLLGMAPASVASIGRHTLGQIQELAEAHPEWLRPRWPARVHVWCELLLAAGAGEPQRLERARLRGLTLLAAEARRASARSGAGADLSAAVSLPVASPYPQAERRAGV